MFKKLTLLMVVAALTAGAASAAVVYDNTSGPYFSSGTNPPRALDDGAFDPANPTPTAVDAVETAFVILGQGPADVYMEVTFYDTIQAGNPQNIDPLGGFVLPLLGYDPGFYSTGDLVLDSPIVFPDNDWAVDIVFKDAAGALSNRGSVVFSGGGVTVGSSQDVYWRDANGNGQYDDTDARYFGGTAGNLANFYLKMNGTAIPEPGTMALLGAGLLPALGLIRRRRS